MSLRAATYSLRSPSLIVVSALIYDMIFTQPVFYEFEQIKPPVLLMIGDKDTTAIGKDRAAASVHAGLGNYPALGKAPAARIPHARLIEFPDLGHAPQIQAPDAFHAALLDGLASLSGPEAGPSAAPEQH